MFIWCSNEHNYTLSNTIFIHESIKISVNVYAYRYVRYNSLPGPDLWCNVHQCWSTCGSDVRQSPINIDTSQTTKRHFDDLKFLNLNRRVPARIFNNGMHMHMFNVNGWKTGINWLNTGINWLISIVSRPVREHFTHHYCRWRAAKFRLTAFNEGGIFIIPHLLWHGTSVFTVSSEGPPAFSPLLRQARGTEDLF